MRRILAVGAAIGLTGTSLAQSANWQLVVHDRETQLLYDTNSVKRDGAAVAFKVRIVPDKPDNWATATAEFRIDCTAQTKTMLRITSYDRNGATLQSSQIPDDRAQAEPILAGENFSGLYARLCPGGKPLPSISGPPIVTMPK